jgi:hypothetical protein
MILNASKFANSVTIFNIDGKRKQQNKQLLRIALFFQEKVSFLLAIPS